MYILENIADLKNGILTIEKSSGFNGRHFNPTYTHTVKWIFKGWDFNIVANEIGVSKLLIPLYFIGSSGNQTILYIFASKKNKNYSKFKIRKKSKFENWISPQPAIKVKSNNLNLKRHFQQNEELIDLINAELGALDAMVMGRELKNKFYQISTEINLDCDGYFKLHNAIKAIEIAVDYFKNSNLNNNLLL